MTPLRTQRLVLRRFHDDDAARLTVLIGEFAVAKWLTHVPHPYTENDARDFFAGRANSDGTLAITRDGALIGCCGLEDELGYWLATDAWGYGYATEASTAMLDRHFASSQEDVRSGYLLGNAGSARVLEKLGFENRPIQEVPSVALGKQVKVQKMALTAEKWAARA